MQKKLKIGQKKNKCERDNNVNAGLSNEHAVNFFLPTISIHLIIVITHRELYISSLPSLEVLNPSLSLTLAHRQLVIHFQFIRCGVRMDIFFISHSPPQ